MARWGDPNRPCDRCGLVERDYMNRCMPCKRAWNRGKMVAIRSHPKRDSVGCANCGNRYRPRPYRSAYSSYCTDDCRRAHQTQTRTERQRFVVHELARAGIFNNPMLQHEVADLLGITHQRVSQIEEVALRKLRRACPHMAEFLLGE